MEVEATLRNLNGLDGIHPWDFTARNVLEKRIEYYLDNSDQETNEAAITTDSSTLVRETEKSEHNEFGENESAEPNHDLESINEASNLRKC